MDTADPQELRKLTSATEATYKLILSGTTPDDAVIKTASAQKFNENWSRRLCELTNRILALDHMETAEKKASAHPVVNPDTVIASLFPAELQPKQVAKAAAQLVVSPVTYGLLDKLASTLGNDPKETRVREGLKMKGVDDKSIESIVGKLKKKNGKKGKTESNPTDFDYVTAAPSKSGAESKCAHVKVASAPILPILPDTPNAPSDSDKPKKKKRVAVSPSVDVSEDKVALEQKSASFPFDPAVVAHRKGMMIETVKRAMKDLQAFNFSIEHNIADAMRKAARALSVHPEIKFRDVEERTLAKFGPDADGAIDLLTSYVKDASRFDGKPRMFTTNPWNRSPFIEVADAVKTLCKEACVAIYVDKQLTKCAALLAKMTKSSGMFSGAADAAKNMASGATGLVGSATTGVGSALSSAAGAAMGMPGKLLGAAKALKGEVESGGGDDGMSVDDTIYNTTNVDSMNVQSSIDARMALADALSDDVISTYPVSKVIGTYNRLADIYPRAVVSSATLIPMLRRTLANPDVEAHDITMSQKVEEGLAKSQDPTKIS